jgi:type II secretory pathway component PulM
VDFLFAAPALPLDEAGKYVAGAYVVFLFLIVVYVAIMAAKLQRMEKELRELASFAEQGTRHLAGTSDEVAGQANQAPQGGSARPTAPGREAEEAVGGAQPAGDQA